MSDGVGEVTRPSLSGARQRIGAGDRSRTRDILLTREALYQLSYTGMRRTSYAEGQLIPPSKARIEPVIIRAAGDAR